MPEKKHLRGVGAKEQRQYEHMKEKAQKNGRYGTRAKGGRRSHGDEAAPQEGTPQGPVGRGDDPVGSRIAASGRCSRPPVG